jgi:hypothetical protein
MLRTPRQESFCCRSSVVSGTETGTSRQRPTGSLRGSDVQHSSPLVSITRLDSLVRPFGDEVETARTMTGWDGVLLRAIVARAYGIAGTCVDAHVEFGPDRQEYLVVRLNLPPE